ncbi:hypothetical protein GF325_10560 [Candidatus Bathyarchaeota archaeon]|nr:hypothetical protein [Candidatus Bathyarchaeota archaeon]
MDMEDLLRDLRSDERFARKFLLNSVLGLLPAAGEIGGEGTNRIYKSMGEDAAAIEIRDKYILVSTDMISPSLIKENPESAGYSAILVGIDDIYASGGHPITCTIEVQAGSSSTIKQVMQGAARASRHFAVPICRGHTSLQESGPALSCTVIGEIDKEFYVSAGGAVPGDIIILIWDPDGRKSKIGPYWDTVSMKTSSEIQYRLHTMIELAGKKLLQAAKDVSNSGVLGTTYMMLNYSQAGGRIDIGNIKQIFSCRSKKDLYWWLMAYLTNAFVVTAKASDLPAIQAACSLQQLKANQIGTVNEGSILFLEYDGQSHPFLDWTKQPVLPDRT